MGRMKIKVLEVREGYLQFSFLDDDFHCDVPCEGMTQDEIMEIAKQMRKEHLLKQPLSLKESSCYVTNINEESVMKDRLQNNVISVLAQEKITLSKCVYGGENLLMRIIDGRSKVLFFDMEGDLFQKCNSFINWAQKNPGLTFVMVSKQAQKQMGILPWNYYGRDGRNIFFSIQEFIFDAKWKYGKRIDKEHTQEVVFV